MRRSGLRQEENSNCLMADQTQALAAAVVVAFGQVLLDQRYYSKAIATTDNKSMLKAYVVGTLIAGVPIPIICGNVFGTGYIALKEQFGLVSVSAGSDKFPLMQASRPIS